MGETASKAASKRKSVWAAHTTLFFGAGQAPEGWSRAETMDAVESHTNPSPTSLTCFPCPVECCHLGKWGSRAFLWVCLPGQSCPGHFSWVLSLVDIVPGVCCPHMCEERQIPAPVPCQTMRKHYIFFFNFEWKIKISSDPCLTSRANTWNETDIVFRSSLQDPFLLCNPNTNRT